MKSKGQLSMEFLIAFLIVLAIFAMNIFIFESRNTINIVNAESWQGNQVADSFSRNINYIYLLDDNTSKTEFIEWSLGASIEENSIIVFGSKGSIFTAPIIPKNVQWEITDINGQITFRKTNGLVVVSYE